MRKLSGAEIRRTWIEFFKSKGHQYIPGVNLVPQGDKSLLWVNAGVTGLKKYFDGSEIPPSRRIVNVQKCIRTNDIENVGHTARHHTFFEMLGNFSIGDYFRDEVIPWAYEILTSESVGFGIDPNKLYITYQPDDKATLELWVKCGMARDHMIPMESNFWEIGEGPCGPDTEMFFDRGEAYDPDHIGVDLLRKDIENDRYIEIWNIVFSQYNSVAGVARKDYKELPSKNIDTGSGLERLACILQGTETNFETDLFYPIIEAVKKLCGVPYEGENLMSYRVIADHARSLTFALSDGAYFSNEGRGYVLRRIIRRAMRYGKKLGIKDPFMYRLVPVVADLAHDFYPEIGEKVEFVAKTIKGEEEKFLRTLEAGESMLRAAVEGKDALPGEVAFRLYDTFGFPFDLTKEICLELGVNVDEEGFNELMKQQRERARAAREDTQSFHKQSKDLLAFEKPSSFLYEGFEVKAKVTGLFVDGVAVDRLDEEGDVALDSTVFYAESGGQVSDMGELLGESFSAKVSSVGKAPRGQHLHHVHLDYGTVQVGDEVIAKIDVSKRLLTMRNHSATHLLHAAIGEVLGGHVDQKGSYVDSEILRFDYSALQKPTAKELSAIEELVNKKILESIEEKTLVLPIEEAKKLGAEMEFSEKYGETVRVVTFGEFSKEFCGGTHVRNSADIGLFVIEYDTAVSSGVRRIQGRTSYGAYRYLSQKALALGQISAALGGAKDGELPSRLASLKEQLVSSAKTIEALKDKIASNSAKGLAESFEDVDGVKFLAKTFDGMGRNDLMKLGDSLKVKYPDYLLFLLGRSDAGVAIASFAGGLGAKRLGAGKAIKLAAPLLGGNGGGRDEMAQGSAKDLAKLDEAIIALRNALKGE
ncbi:MAG: alanine--tRNA ligase [Bacilli bacterium]|nr:alanine--tRNA ligase [Bacilli bacterium]